MKRIRYREDTDLLGFFNVEYKKNPFLSAILRSKSVSSVYYSQQ
jgi:hypothetical protein